MELLSFAVRLMSGATLLIFAVHFMRVGIERLFSRHIMRMMDDSGARVRLMARGTGLGFVMQGATAVLMMAATLAGNGVIPVASAVLLALGAEVGSALAVQFLQLPVSALGPIAILVGGWLYMQNPPGRRPRDAGRILLGLGVLFLSLGIIRDAVAPLRDLPATAALISAIGNDPVNAALLGLVLALIMHSSLAAILTVVALAAHVAVAPVQGFATVLGCNIASALLPLWLLRSENPEALVAARTIAILRVAVAGALLFALIVAHGPIATILPAVPTPRLMIAGHLGFNFLLLAFAPLAVRICALLLASERAAKAGAGGLTPPDVAQEGPQVTVAELKRRTGVMLDRLARMLDNVTAAIVDREALAGDEASMNADLSELRQMFAQLPDYTEPVARQVYEIMDFAIRIERCADTLSGRYLDIRDGEYNGEFTLADAGAREIAGQVALLRKTLLIARSVVWSEDLHLARTLVEHKQEMTALEETIRRAHLRRIREGDARAIDSGNQQLELIAALKEINSKLATIGYAVLEKHGALRKTRLKGSVRKSTA